MIFYLAKTACQWRNHQEVMPAGAEIIGEVAILLKMQHGCRQLEPEEVETAAARDLAGIRRDRKAARLKAWKP